MDTCDIQIGIPIYQKLISESVVWNSRSPRCLITVLISSPQHQQQPPPRVLDYWEVGFRATPTAVGSLLLLAHGSPVLLWLRCCCLLLNITAAGSMAGPGWCRVHYQLPDSAAQHTLLALTLASLHSYLLNVGAMGWQTKCFFWHLSQIESRIKSDTHLPISYKAIYMYVHWHKTFWENWSFSFILISD